MTLRRTLLLAFVLLGLLPSAALSWLSFTRTRDAMTDQIQVNLTVQAASIQADIDQMLFERFENAIVWSRSELMQDLRLGDVDKRVTNYLVDLHAGYRGVYEELDCQTEDGRILASSLPARIGSSAAPVTASSVTVHGALGNAHVDLSLPQTSLLDDGAPLTIETRIDSPYAGDRSFDARLRATLNARQISRLLDAAAVGRRVIVVVDEQGRWVAGSKTLRGTSLPDSAGRAAGMVLARERPRGIIRGAPWLVAAALSGSGRSKSTPNFAGSGWTTFVFEPVDEALAPVSTMAAIFTGLLFAVLVATVLAAAWIAPTISRPIIALTNRTRRHQRGLGVGDDPPLRSGIVELDVLATAYDEMVRAVERSRLELVRTSKLAMLGELAAVLAHEVRTPLGILRSSAQILRRDPGLKADGHELMAFIESETERLNRLVSTMLDTAKPRPPELVPCDIHGLLRRCAQMHDLRRGPDGSARPVLLDLAASGHVALVDAEQIMQAIFNLLGNASQAAGATGRVELATADGPQGLYVACSDDGPGIADEFVERMFDPFVTGREGGIGLGLSVVRQVALAHHGEVVVGRSQWGGARFTIRIPRSMLATSLEEMP